MQLAIALLITIVSSCALNGGYLLEHGAVSTMPALTIRAPLRSLRALLGSRRWLLGFGIEIVGWGLYVAAVALAPLSLVQATAAGGIGILAIMASRFTHVPLEPRERIGVCISVAGLALLGVSLAGGHGGGTHGTYLSVAVWLGASLVAAFLAVKLLSRAIGGGPAFGLATGILFAAGDVATKATVGGGAALVFALGLIVCYALGTGVLQAGFQRGRALTTAGIATIVTNALPIVAGMTIFSEPLPDGWLGAVRVAAFVAVVAGAGFLARAAGSEPEPAHGPEPLEPSPRPS